MADASRLTAFVTPIAGRVRLFSYQACQATRRVVVVSAPRMLNELHGAELHGTLERVLRRYVRAELLVIDDFAVLAMDTALLGFAHPKPCDESPGTCHFLATSEVCMKDGEEFAL